MANNSLRRELLQLKGQVQDIAATRRSPSGAADDMMLFLQDCDAYACYLRGEGPSPCKVEGDAACFAGVLRSRGELGPNAVPAGMSDYDRSLLEVISDFLADPHRWGD